MKLKVRGHHLHCRWEGPADRPVVVLSHSLATSGGMWEPQVAVLGRSHRVLVCDTLGHGLSDAPPGPYSLEGLADDAAALLDAVGVERADFVGLSMGGMIGQVLALRRPEKIRRLVLCDTTSRIPPESRPSWDERIRVAGQEGMEPLVEPTVGRWFTPEYLERRKDIVDRVRAMIRATAPAGYIGCCQAIAGLDLTDRLRGIRLPTLVVVGADDPGTPVSAAEVIHREIPSSRLEVIPSASHLCNLEQSEEFNRRLLDFLA